MCKCFVINNDGKLDKIFSKKQNTGDELLVYFFTNKGYSLVLKTINFSQDGGHQISDIKKSENGFMVETNFEKGIDKYQYFINFKNNEFILEKANHTIDSWQNKEEKTFVFYPKINLNKTKSADEIFGQLIDAEEKINKN